MADGFVVDSFVDAWWAGYAAGGEGVAASVNPHPARADLALDWADGWREGAQARSRREMQDPGVSGAGLQ